VEGKRKLFKMEMEKYPCDILGIAEVRCSGQVKGWVITLNKYTSLQYLITFMNKVMYFYLQSIKLTYGEQPSSVVTLERRYGPRRLHDDDDDELHFCFYSRYLVCLLFYLAMKDSGSKYSNFESISHTLQY